MTGDSPRQEAGQESAPLFYSEGEAAALLGLHRTTLRTLALEGTAPIEPVHVSAHKRIYRRVDIERLAGVER